MRARNRVYRVHALPGSAWCRRYLPKRARRIVMIFFLDLDPALDPGAALRRHRRVERR